MILEWLEYLKTKSTKAAKDWGYVYQNISLKFRSRRCAKAWKNHNENSRQFIRDHLAKIQPKSVMVIGSGLLLEVPIETLLEKTEKLYLVDLVHAREIRKLAPKNSKKGYRPFSTKKHSMEAIASMEFAKSGFSDFRQFTFANSSDDIGSSADDLGNL